MRKVSRYVSSPPVKQSVALKSSFALILRIALVGCSLIASATLAFVLLVHVHSDAHADPTLVQAQVPAINSSYGVDPWDIKFDNSGHVFVAEPQCDPDVNKFPVCTPPPNQIGIQSGIIEYSTASFTNGAQPIKTLNEPSGYTSPFFLAFDSSGNLWFSEPVSNSIGEYDTGGNWHQWSVPTAGASPFDLTFDQYGHLWFTELTANKIGEFNPASGTFINEYAPPTANSRPYGITGPDPTDHSIWFTENSATVHRIGQIMPNPNGTIQGQIKEYLTHSNSSSGITPHLITYDHNGNIWWSEGYDGSIGQLVISQARPGTNTGVTEHVVPLAACSPTCGATHISGIGVDSSGTIWFDDSLTSRYGSYNPSNGQFNMYVVGTLGGNNHPHDGLAVDCNNNVWFSEEFANALAEAQVGAGNNQSCGSPQPSPTVSPSPHRRRHHHRPAQRSRRHPRLPRSPGRSIRPGTLPRGASERTLPSISRWTTPPAIPARSISNTCTRLIAARRR